MRGLAVLVTLGVLGRAANAFHGAPALPGTVVSRARLCHPPPPQRQTAPFLRSLRAQQVTREVLTAGDGATFPEEGDTVTVHYEGKLAREGTVFDCSYGGDPFSFQIGQGQVIKVCFAYFGSWVARNNNTADRPPACSRGIKTTLEHENIWSVPTILQIACRSARAIKSTRSASKFRSVRRDGIAG